MGRTGTRLEAGSLILDLESEAWNLIRKFDYREKKRTVKELIEWLKQFPEDAYVYAYSGECTGIAVVKQDEELGWLETFDVVVMQVACS